MTPAHEMRHFTHPMCGIGLVLMACGGDVEIGGTGGAGVGGAGGRQNDSSTTVSNTEPPEPACESRTSCCQMLCDHLFTLPCSPQDMPSDCYCGTDLPEGTPPQCIEASLAYLQCFAANLQDAYVCVDGESWLSCDICQDEAAIVMTACGYNEITCPP